MTRVGRAALLACAVSFAGCSHASAPVVTPQQRMAAEAKVLRAIGIPMYPGMVTIEGYDTTGRQGQDIKALFLRTQDPIAQVAAFYKANVPTPAKSTVFITGKSGMANFTYEDGRVEKQITLTTGANATEIELLAITKKP
jgi:hypothetical protein